jgi:hypothetical protein
VLAGGAEEVAAWPEWLLWSVFLFFVGGAPVKFCGGSSSIFVLAALWSGVACPSPESKRRRIQVLKILKALVMLTTVLELTVQGGGFSEFEVRRLLVR